MIVFSQRKALEREFLRWCRENKVAVTPASMLGFFDLNGFINQDKVIEFLKGAEDE